MQKFRLSLLTLGFIAIGLSGQVTRPATSTNQPATARGRSVCSSCIRAHMEVLASDTMRGRGSGTEDEHRAANYIAGILEQCGIPASQGGYLQQAAVILRKPVGPAQLRFRQNSEGTPALDVTWTHGKEILVVNLTRAEVSGSLQKIDHALGNQEIKPGSVVYLDPKEGKDPRGDIEQLLYHGAVAVLIPETPAWRSRWESRGKQLVHLPGQLAEPGPPGLGDNSNIVVISRDAAHMLKDVPDGVSIRLQVPTSTPVNTRTWNVVGVLRGRDPALRDQAILFSAHLDHLGIGEPVNGDSIYNGADDDASGVAAVLELARVLGAGQRPRRTVIFALFGSEEAGGLGSAYFREHPPVPLKQITTNLEFEMIGRSDPAVPNGTLWLTGWTRSNLGPELAAHGAKLVADPHPAENFFARSDNFVLAKKGVVAQTVSSFGLHKDYHKPSDDLEHIDFPHMDQAVGSLLDPLEWLVNSDFVPRWNEGGQP